MPKVSVGIALLLGLALAYLVLNIIIVWNSVPTSDKFRVIFEFLYMALTAVTGWIYIAGRSRISGWIHALLMLGLTGICGYYGFTVLGDHSIGGGSGPDANPVGWILYGTGFIYCVVALVTAICAIGVMAHILKNKKNTGS
jgi:hypothetical protein